jgi:hypothetical protein
MPNHVKNIVDFSGFSKEKFAEIQAGILGELLEDGTRRLFDFSLIIPPPEHPEYNSNNNKHPMNWYVWNIENWGTKWNSYDLSTWKKQRISFCTAWSMPEPVFKALSLKYPEAKIEVSFADEDIGCNCGVAVYKAGVRADYFQWDNRSHIACKFARMVRGAA